MVENAESLNLLFFQFRLWVHGIRLPVRHIQNVHLWKILRKCFCPFLLLTKLFTLTRIKWEKRFNRIKNEWIG